MRSDESPKPVGALDASDHNVIDVPWGNPEAPVVKDLAGIRLLQLAGAHVMVWAGDGTTRGNVPHPAELLFSSENEEESKMICGQALQILHKRRESNARKKEADERALLEKLKKKYGG